MNRYSLRGSGFFRVSMPRQHRATDSRSIVATLRLPVATLSPMLSPSMPLKSQSRTVHPYQDIKSIQSSNQCFSWWMIHCFLYYRYDNPVISDKDFDTLTSWVKMSWQSIDHLHKHLVTIDDLNANSGYAIQYPLMVQSAAMQVLREIEQKLARHEPASKPIKEQAKKANKTDQTFNEYDSLFT